MLVFSLMLGSVGCIIPIRTYAAKSDAGKIIEADNTPLRLYYDEEASHGVAQGYDEVHTYFGSSSDLIAKHPNDDWERWSIPLGNGIFGANIFGRTETERIQITDKTLANPYRVQSNSSHTDGLNNFSETYIDLGHKNADVTGYSRELDLHTAVSTVKYVYNGVTYAREYFTSYPDNAMIIRLDASEAGALDFVLRPTIPYEQKGMNADGDGAGKWGTVESSVNNGIGSITLSGKLEWFDIDFVGLYTVITDGTGTVSATTCVNKDGDTDGTITVKGAKSAYVIINLGTDYELCEEMFINNSRTSKPTFKTDLAYSMTKVEGMKAKTLGVIDGKSFEDGYNSLKTNHINDYSEIFGRVSLDLDFDERDITLTTDALLSEYKAGSGSSYLEALYFQYGRYLLLASSRKGGLPANLQGTWNRYNHAPWASGYWHNVNVQMNYWPAFSTNIAETFEAYVDYNNAYMPEAERGSTSIVNQYNPSANGKDGGNGWSIATGGYPHDVNAADSLGNLGFTTQLFWEYYQHTGDKEILRGVGYPILTGAARFITKMVKKDANGNYIAIRTDSPEQYVNGAWYYTDKGATYAQSFSYQNNYNMLLAAKELGIDFSDATGEDYEIIQTVLEQIDNYSPVVIGLSGHVKEFFEEDYYGDMGEYTHRHISQLVGLYPGNVINGTTPAWLDAAKIVLTERGDKATGWGVAHRLNLWARVQDGERAYDLLEMLLKVNTATNLWDLHPPFQIDGNLGGTAGVSEMLLQSHAGYIEPLAAIPSAWANGSFTGLVARGNFVVAAEWENGLATCLNITSQNGGSASVKYSGIGNAVVRTTDGTVVNYTVTGEDLITFDTTAGETYIISGFSVKVKPAAVTGLTTDAKFLGETKLTWSHSSDAVAYRVYIARESDATYTLLGTTTQNTYTYTPAALENDRITFAVTAVNAAGVESGRTLVYRNPDDTSASVEKISANIVDGELQVAINATEYAKTYRLYSRISSKADWTLVSESKYPIIKYADFVPGMHYGVSVESYFGGESEIVNISAFNHSFEESDYTASNILVGRDFSPTSESAGNIHATAYGYHTLTDGKMFGDNVHDGRFSTPTPNKNPVSATVELGGYFLLADLRFYDFQGAAKSCNYMGESLKVEAYTLNGWITVHDISSNAEILGHRAGANGSYHISLDMSGVIACKLRITLNGSHAGNSVSIWEIQCSGIKDPRVDAPEYRDNLLLDKRFEVTAQTDKHTAPDNGSSSIDGLTDGTYQYSENSKWWRLWWNQADMTFDGTIDLSGVATLGELRIFDYQATYSSVSPKIEISYYYDGVWTTAHSVELNSSNIATYRRVGTVDTEKTESWLAFDMGGVSAEKIRIYMPPKSTGVYGMYEVTLSGYIVPDEREYSSNLLAGEYPVYSETNGNIVKNSYGVYGYEKLTDGNIEIHAGRFAIDAKENNYATVTYSLHGSARLETLVVKDFCNGNTTPRSNETTIELLVDGEWVKYLDAQPLFTDPSIWAKEGNARIIKFDLSGYTASQIRITFKNNYAKSGNTEGVTIAEIELSGWGKAFKGESKENVFTGHQFVAGPDAGPVWTPNTYDKITDGVASSDSNRFSTSGNTSKVDGILDFGGNVAELHILRVTYNQYNTSRCGKDLIIEVWLDGEWHTVINHVYTAPTKYMEFDLGGVLAEKVRVRTSGGYTGGDCTQIYEMTCSGFISAPATSEGPIEDPDSNVLLGIQNEQLSVQGATLHHDTRFNNLEYAFDGNLGTRYALKDESPFAYSLEIDLCATYPLYTLAFYPFFNKGELSRSNDTSIDVYLDGVWITVATGIEIAPSTTPTTVDLGGIKGSRIRINFKNTATQQNATIFEITCTTGTVTAVDRTALLDAYIALDSLASEDFGFTVIKDIRMKELSHLLSDTTAKQTDIDGYVAEINSAVQKLSAGIVNNSTVGDFTKQNASLRGDVSINLYGNITNSTVAENPNAVVYIEYPDGRSETVNLSELERVGDNLMIAIGMAAAQMTDTVKARLILNGETAGAVIETSVRDYVDIILADPTFEAATPGINDLLVAMLNYGARAQTVFDYNTDNLANRGHETDVSGVSESGKLSVIGSANGIAVKSWTLTLDSEITAKIYFELDGSDVKNYSVVLTDPSGNERQLGFEKIGDRYRVRVENIPAGYLNDGYTVTIKNIATAQTLGITFRATDYVGTVLSDPTAFDPQIIELVRALRAYSDVADTFVKQNSAKN